MDFVAIYAAIAATIALVWNMVRISRDRRGRLNLSLHIVKEFGLLPDESPVDTGKPLEISLAVYNVGQKPISIGMWCIDMGGGYELQISLEPPEVCIEFEWKFLQSTPLPRDVEEVRMIERIYAVDITGKRWNVDSSRLAAFIAVLEEEAPEG